MKKKIVGILVCTLLIATMILPVTGKITISSTVDRKSNSINHSDFINSDASKLKWMIAGSGLRCLRSYWLHVPPSYDETESVPLVIVLHGSTGPVTSLFSNLLWWFGSSWIEDYTDFSAKADEEGFIAVYPNSKLNAISDNLALLFAFDVPTYSKWILLRNLIDDDEFIRDLIENMKENYNIDSDRIYITGISNGADFTYYLGAYLSDIVAAIAPVAGYIAFKGEDGVEFRYPPDPTDPVSVIVFHGTDDCYEGQCGTHVGVNESVQYWVDHNECNPEPEINISESGLIIRRTYTAGEDGTEVILYTTVDGGHWWPGNDRPPDDPLHDPINETSATDLIWDFFEQHPKQ